MRFRKTYIEIVNQCNLSCAFCPGTRRNPRFMDDTLFESVCAQIRGLSERVYFHVMGEPLLHPRIGEYLDKCNSFGLSAFLVTNGLLLAERIGSIARKPALRQVHVSLHSVAGILGDGELRGLIAAVKSLASGALVRPDLTVQMRFWNRGAADPAFQAKAFGFIQEIFGLPYSIEERLRLSRSFMLQKNVSIDCTAPFTWPSLDNDDYGDRGTCYGLRKQCAILADGTVTPCCLDNNGALALGTIEKQTLADILAGERATAIRKGFERGLVVEELCRRCAYRLRFGAASPAGIRK
jgi:radical SAM protein with 4Fe4S-binding SPASM domain